MESHPITEEDGDKRVDERLNMTANSSNLVNQSGVSTPRSPTCKANVVKLSELVRRDIFKEGTFSKRYEGRGYKLVVEKYNNNDYKIKRYPLPDAPLEHDPDADNDSEGCEIWDDCPKQVSHLPFLKPNIQQDFYLF